LIAIPIAAVKIDENRYRKLLLKYALYCEAIDLKLVIDSSMNILISTSQTAA
jgi:hypothetical protein